MKLYLIRHGVSEMNVALSAKPWGSINFSDPGIFDAPLTQLGIDQASNTPPPSVDLVVSSPLTRALQTTQGVFGTNQKVLALPLASERVYLSSDVGTPTPILRERWPNVSFDRMPEEWWYRGDKNLEWRPPGEYLCPGEPKKEFMERMAALKKWLLGREEDSIALVCHWGVCYSLTGLDFDNCQVQQIDPNIKLVEPPY